MTLEKFEPRYGGRWRYIHQDKDGNKFGFHGVYHEMSPSLMIDTFEFEGLPEKGHVSLETARLEDSGDGKTKLTIQAVFQSVADRDGMTQSGMEEGVSESHERLDELLGKMEKSGWNRSTTAEFNAYLRFNGNCREAMEFYKACLGGQLNLMIVGESPDAAQMPAEVQNKIMHSTLTNGSIMIMGSDIVGAEEYRHGNTVSLCLVCQSKEEINTLFSKLSSGGKVIHPLKEEFFGTYGDIIDKYGFSWMFQFSGTQKLNLRSPIPQQDC
jgi:uncharacterized glyoxalase superfamily protein PhnB